MEKSILSYARRIYKKLTNQRPIPIKYKQELLLLKALEEKGYDSYSLSVSCDHDLGINYVNGIEMGIKYPDSFYSKAKAITPKHKSYSFYFNGFMNPEGGRKKMVSPFETFEDALIIASEEGRNQSLKDSFNQSYFENFAKAKFGLCPHQLDWSGSKENMWTYRFVESCLVCAIPIIFDATPLGKKFIQGFHTLRDSDFMNDNCLHYDHAKALDNLELAKTRFFLTDEECKRISLTL